jgi:cytochrome c biogenesis protein CcmG, thiol:disulfide interchange protein DsbE
VNRFLIPGGIFLVLAGVLFVGVVRSPDKSTLTSVLLGKPAPEFSLPLLGEPGTQVKSTAFAGHPWVLNVWATWCVACREEHEALLAIARQSQVPLVGLDWRDEDAAAGRWLAQLGNPYTVVAVDREGRTAIDFGVYGAPETFFIDATGHVQYRHVGAMTAEVWQREFESRLRKPLAP